ncbi:hypothetical protein, unlikely [Trypanosoma congolense IL3000]|uniref:Uncharacterized protein n=1 Tax=Trypanosoma congolense (strain IL3000) TaxID=1068625 RepID=F9W520_TRYCI|nr:hypothetical protein, unlikely [Trypanosoma congolense IL3000]
MTPLETTCNLSRGPAPMTSTPFTDTGDSIGVPTPPSVSPYITLKTHPQVHSIVKMPKHTCRGDGTTPLPSGAPPRPLVGTPGRGTLFSSYSKRHTWGAPLKEGKRAIRNLLYPGFYYLLYFFSFFIFFFFCQDPLFQEN